MAGCAKAAAVKILAKAGLSSPIRFVVVLVLASAMGACFTVTTSPSFTQKELTKKAEVAVATPTNKPHRRGPRKDSGTILGQCARDVA